MADLDLDLPPGPVQVLWCPWCAEDECTCATTNPDAVEALAEYEAAPVIPIGGWVP